MKKRMLTAILLAVGLVLVCAAGWALHGWETRAVMATVSNGNDKGIAPDAAFTLALDCDDSAQALRERITTSPETAFSLEGTGRAFVLKPLRPLAGGEEFAFAVTTADGRTKTFRYKVRNELLVKGHYPADGALGVPSLAGVEVQFNSERVTLENFQKAFTITPPVEGLFTAGGGRMVFSPDAAGYEFDTTYTVTIDPSLTAEDGAELGVPLTFSFTTISAAEQELGYRFRLSEDGNYNTLTDEVPLIGVYMDRELPAENRTISVEVYRYDSAEDYADAMVEYGALATGRRDERTITRKGLQLYTSFEADPVAPMQDAEHFYASNDILAFPEPLPEGWYLAQFTLDVEGVKITRQQLIQSSDVSVFFMSLQDEVVAWINDAASGQPIADAKFESHGQYNISGKTGADGVARLSGAKIEADMNRYYERPAMFTITAGEHTFIDSFVFHSDGSPNNRQDYYTYLFTDRPIYRTTDTIKVWGVVRPRGTGKPVPQEIRVKVDDATSVILNPMENGTFKGELKLENYGGDMWGAVSLAVVDGTPLDEERALSTVYITIEDFVKPVYTAETYTDKPVYLLGVDETAAVTFAVSTFDGTPVAGFGANLELWSAGLTRQNEQPLVTDENGLLTVPLVIGDSIDTWRPQSPSYQFSNAQAESENFYAFGSVNVIERDLALRANVHRGGGTVDISTNRVDISGIKEEADLWKKEALIGAATDTEVTAQIHRTWYEKIPQGQYYDFIARKTVQSYYHRRRDDIVDTRTFTTSNGQYTLTDLPESDDESCYYMVFTATDSMGRTVRELAYLGAFYERYIMNSDGIHHYGLNKQADLSSLDLNELDDWSFQRQLSDLQSQFVDNENVAFQLKDNNEPVESFTGRILCAVVQKDLSDLRVVESDSFTLPYAEELLPNYTVTGAYFDGKHIYALNEKRMHFNPIQRELELTITPERETVAPGDTVSASVAVKNKFTGKPAADTTVLLAAVDEAIFALREQSSEILDPIYTQVFYPIISKYTSYVQVQYGGGGEKGGGGGDPEVRKDFADTACFETQKTDQNGVATFTFQLPDNVTSWRLTTLGLSEGAPQAGDSKTNIYATLPFFVQPIANEKILAGDDFTVCLRATGREITSHSQVDYEVRVQGNGFDETQKLSGAARAYTNAVFSNLQTGDYTVTVTGRSGEYADAVELPFTVAKTGVELSLVKNIDLREGITVEPLRYPVTVALYDKAWSGYSSVFSSVLGWGGDGRADQRIAARYAAQVFHDEGVSWYDEDALKDNLADVGAGNILYLTKNDQNDIELTVKAHLAMPELFSQKHSELEGLSPSDSWMMGRSTAIYLAQALAGEVDVQEVKNLLETKSDLDLVDQMYLACALSVAGETDAAKQAFDTLVRPRLKTLEGISGVQAQYVQPNGEALSAPEYTAAASMLASLNGEVEAEALARYLAVYPSKFEPFVLEQILYLRRCDGPEQVSAKASWTKNGQRTTEELGRGITYLSLGKDALAQADFQVESGEVLADIYYIGTPDQAAGTEKKKIGLQKTIESADGGPIRQGSLVKITLRPDIAAFDQNLGDVCMTVDDYIPSGMRFERYGSADSGYGWNSWYLDSRQGQRMRFSFFGMRMSIGPIYYYARCALPGEYVVENAYIASETAETWGMSERQSVHIS